MRTFDCPCPRQLKALESIQTSLSGIESIGVGVGRSRAFFMYLTVYSFCCFCMFLLVWLICFHPFGGCIMLHHHANCRCTVYFAMLLYCSLLVLGHFSHVSCFMMQQLGAGLKSSLLTIWSGMDSSHIRKSCVPPHGLTELHLCTG